MEYIIILILGFTLGVFTQYNFRLWQGTIRMLCFGLFNISRHDSSKILGSMDVAGYVPMAFAGGRELSLNDISIIALDKIIKDSNKQDLMIALDKGKYNTFIKFKIELKEASV